MGERVVQWARDVSTKISQYLDLEGTLKGYDYLFEIFILVNKGLIRSVFPNG